MVNQPIGNHWLGIYWCGQFDLEPLLQGQTKIAKLQVFITRILLVLEVGMVNQHIRNHGLGFFWCGQI